MQTPLVNVVAAAVCLVVSGAGCRKGAERSGESEERTTLTVAVASSMRPAFEEIAAAWSAGHPDVGIEATFGASGVFFAQLSQRAPFDMFLSADMGYPRQLVAAGHADEVFPYARGRLVLWASARADLAVAKRGMDALADPRVTRIAIANPDLAPYGRAAMAVLEHFGLVEATADRLVRGENVAQTAQYVESGAAQIGLLPASLTVVPPLRDSGDAWPVPTDIHKPIAHGGVITGWSAHPAAAAALRDFLLGPDGREILDRHGFVPPES